MSIQNIHEYKINKRKKDTNDITETFTERSILSEEYRGRQLLVILIIAKIYIVLYKYCTLFDPKILKLGAISIPIFRCRNWG